MNSHQPLELKTRVIGPSVVMVYKEPLILQIWKLVVKETDFPGLMMK
jgi:hypothetical protein